MTATTMTTSNKPSTNQGVSSQRSRLDIAHDLARQPVKALITRAIALTYAVNHMFVATSELAKCLKKLR